MYGINEHLNEGFLAILISIAVINKLFVISYSTVSYLGLHLSHLFYLVVQHFSWEIITYYALTTAQAVLLVLLTACW